MHIFAPNGDYCLFIPAFDLIWETSAASAAQFKNFRAGSESSIRKMANLARFISLYKK